MFVGLSRGTTTSAAMWLPSRALHCHKQTISQIRFNTSKIFIQDFEKHYYGGYDRIVKVIFWVNLNVGMRHIYENTRKKRRFWNYFQLKNSWFFFNFLMFDFLNLILVPLCLWARADTIWYVNQHLGPIFNFTLVIPVISLY